MVPLSDTNACFGLFPLFLLSMFFSAGLPIDESQHGDINAMPFASPADSLAWAKQLREKFFYGARFGQEIRIELSAILRARQMMLSLITAGAKDLQREAGQDEPKRTFLDEDDGKDSDSDIELVAASEPWRLRNLSDLEKGQLERYLDRLPRTSGTQRTDPIASGPQVSQAVNETAGELGSRSNAEQLNNSTPVPISVSGETLHQ